MLQNQVYIFFIFILNGILIGITFDIFRILRKSFKTSDIITYIEDIIFGILSGIIMLYSIIKFNNGEIRIYLFWGILFGLIFYLLLFSKTFIKISVFVIEIIKQIIKKVVIMPIKFIYRILKRIVFKPIVFICVNIRKNIRKFKFHKIKKQEMN